MRKFTGAEIDRLRKEIVDNFSVVDFPNFTVARLHPQKKPIRFWDVVPVVISGFFEQVFTYIQQLNNWNYHGKLLKALMAEDPENNMYIELAKSIGYIDEELNMYSSTPDHALNVSGLQALINGKPDFNPDQLIKGILDNKRCVCRIEILTPQGTKIHGTGFLVSKDWVMTNYHVVERIISGEISYDSVTCQFDYEIAGDGTLLNTIDVTLDPQPIVAYSPYSNFDKAGSKDINVTWPEDKLDYAILKLSQDMGNNPFGPNATNTTPTDTNKRGWIKYTDSIQNLYVSGSLFILQHPNGKPLKLGIGLEAISSIDNHKRRVRYTINTESGSSGSPCFDHKFNWVALHNSGDPSWNPQYNQGIPAVNIVADLQKKGINLN